MQWKRYEKRVAELVGGRRVPGSGCGYRKGDVWLDDWMLECKLTTKPTYNLTVHTLDKLAQQSLEVGLGAALIILFHRSYGVADMAAVVLERRGEYRPDWKSRRLSYQQLLDQQRLVSRYGEWRVITLEQFVEESQGERTHPTRGGTQVEGTG